MIRTQYINSIKSRPKKIDDFLIINVLNWHNNKWQELSPYCMKTDGNEKNDNPGGIIFENFFQGCKVFPQVYPIKVYSHPSRIGDDKYLWWDFQTKDQYFDKHLDGNDIIEENYNYWRDSLWNCPRPIRYPNGRDRRSKVKFAVVNTTDGKQYRYDYLTMRKKVYYQEYVRLAKKTTEYQELLDMLKNGKNIMICEIDVPKQGKKGLFGQDCDDNNTCLMSLDKLDKLMTDESEPFGHGLCLSHALLSDI